MEKSAFLFFLVFLVGVYAEMPTCVDPPIKNCVLSDETVHATDGETVWKKTEILLHHQVAQNFLSSGKNFQIFWSEDLLSDGPNIVNKMFASKYQARWKITEHIIFTHNDNEWGKVVINVTVRDFKRVDQIYLKVVLHLADGDTLISQKKYWFVYDQNNPAHTTTSPSPTPNITDRNATGKGEAGTDTEKDDAKEEEGTDTGKDDDKKEEHNEDGTQEGKSSNFWTIFGITIIFLLLLLLYVLSICFGIWLYKKVNAIHSQTSGQYMPLSQIDTDGQQPQGSRADTEHLPMSAVVTQDT